MKRLLVIPILICCLLGVRMVNSGIQLRTVPTGGVTTLLQTLGQCAAPLDLPGTLRVLGPSSAYLTGVDLIAAGDESAAYAQFQQNFRDQGRMLSAIMAGLIKQRTGEAEEAARWWAAGLAADGFAAQGKLCGLAGNSQAERANYEAALAAAGLQAVHAETYQSLFQYFGRSGTPQQLQQLGAIFKTAQPDWEHDVQSLYWLGSAYQAQGQLTEALNYFDQAIQLDPKRVDVLYLAGLAAFNQRDFQRAEDYFVRVQALAPNYERSNRLRGEIARRTGRLDEAYQLFERQGDVLGVFGMAQVRFEQKHFDEARQLLQRALSSEPQNVDVRLLLAKVCRMQADTACAVKQYRAALQVEPGNAAARQGLQELGQPGPE